MPAFSPSAVKIPRVVEPMPGVNLPTIHQIPEKIYQEANTTRIGSPQIWSIASRLPYPPRVHQILFHEILRNFRHAERESISLQKVFLRSWVSYPPRVHQIPKSRAYIKYPKVRQRNTSNTRRHTSNTRRNTSNTQCIRSASDRLRFEVSLAGFRIPRAYIKYPKVRQRIHQIPEEIHQIPEEIHQIPEKNTSNTRCIRYASDRLRFEVSLAGFRIPRAYIKYFSMKLFATFLDTTIVYLTFSKNLLSKGFPKEFFFCLFF